MQNPKKREKKKRENSTVKEKSHKKTTKEMQRKHVVTAKSAKKKNPKNLEGMTFSRNLSRDLKIERNPSKTASDPHRNTKRKHRLQQNPRGKGIIEKKQHQTMRIYKK